MRRLALAAVLLLAAGAVRAQGLAEPLTDEPGDPARGRAIMLDTQTSLCLLCHVGPFPEASFQGDIGPDLTGVGDRLTAPELRLRVVDSRRLNPATIMPPFHSLEGLTRVGPRWTGATILSSQEVEDVVSFLTTLKGGP